MSPLLLFDILWFYSNGRIVAEFAYGGKYGSMIAPASRCDRSGRIVSGVTIS